MKINLKKIKYPFAVCLLLLVIFLIELSVATTKEAFFSTFCHEVGTFDYSTILSLFSHGSWTHLISNCSVLFSFMTIWFCFFHNKQNIKYLILMIILCLAFMPYSMVPGTTFGLGASGWIWSVSSFTLLLMATSGNLYMILGVIYVSLEKSSMFVGLTSEAGALVNYKAHLIGAMVGIAVYLFYYFNENKKWKKN